MKHDSSLRSENAALRQRIAELEAPLAQQAGVQPMAPGVPTESSRQFYALFKTMAQGVVYYDAAGAILLANPAAERLLGLSLDEMQGRTSVDPRWHTIREDASAFPSEEHPARVALRSGQPVSDVLMGVFHTHAAAYRWLLVSAIPEFRAGNRQPFRVYATFTDLTERKQAEDHARASARRYRGLVESLNISLCRWRPDTTLVYANDVYCRLFGVSGDVTGRRWLEFLPDDTRAETRAFYRQLADAPRSVTYEHPVTGRDGNMRHFQWIDTPIFSEDGRLVEFQSVGIDITERKQAEDAQRASEHKFFSAFEYAAIGMALVAPDGHWREVNRSICAMLGYGEDELKRTTFQALTHADDLASELALVNRLRAGEIPAYQLEKRYVTKAGDVVWANLSVSLIRDCEGQPSFFIFQVQNITEHKLSELKLRESEARAKATLRAIPDLMFCLDRQGIFVDYRAERKLLYHQTMPSLIGLHSRDTLPPVVSELVNHQLGVTLETGELQTFEYQLEIPGAGMRDFEARMSPSGRDEVIAIVRDITEHKQTEQRLRESERRFRSFFETSAAVMLIVEPDSGVVVEANPAAADFYGYARQQFKGMNIGDINQLPPEQVAHECRRAQTAQENYFIVRHQLASGEARTVEMRAHPILTDGRTLLFFLVYDITERQQIEARLNLEQHKLAQIAVSVPGMIFSFRQFPDGVVGMPYASPTIRDVIGLDQADVADDITPLISRIHPDDLASVIASIAQSARALTLWHTEYRYNHPQKGWIWLEGRSMPTGYPDGSLVWHGFIADVTKRKQSEQIVYAQRDLARSIGSIASMEAGLQVCFETALRISGLDCGGIYLFNSDRTVLELVYHQGLSPGFVQEVARYPYESPVVQSILAGAFIYRLPNEAGQDGLYRREGLRTIGVAPIMFQNSVIGCLNLGAYAPLSVSDSVRQGLDALAAEIGNYIVYLRGAMLLRQSEERYRLLASELEQRVQARTAEVQDLYDNAPTGYHSLDASGRFVMINQTELDWLGYTREELIGRHFADFVTPDSLATFSANFPIFLQRGWVRGLEFDMVRKDGSTFPVLVSGTAILDSAGNFLRSRSTIFDNTERRKAEIALRNSEMQLRLRRDQLSATNVALAKAARLKDEFLASMSHELRTPLTSILGLSEMLQLQTYGTLNQKQLRSLGVIEASGRHLLDLINDILDLSKLEARMLELDIKPVELAGVCQAALQLVKGLANQKGHQVSFAMTPEAVTVYGDERRLKQMLVNLLSNAIKFTPAGRNLGLEVYADPTAETVSLTVWDQGIGIAPADVARLFEPFAQLDNSLARQYEGSGLGLSLVRSMADLHGGSIQVESQLGEGSRFMIVLPWRLTSVTPLGVCLEIEQQAAAI